jgi:D-aminoacyl-tRNA deacylase
VRALLQRVSRASVAVGGEAVAAIGPGLLALVGAGAGDGEADAFWTADKLARLRIFPDEEGRMNLSVADAGGAVLVVSQFTLYGDASRGNRPGFTGAAAPELAVPLLDALVERLRGHGLDVATGRFGAHMQVELVNDGPVTIWLESPRRP